MGYELRGRVTPPTSPDNIRDALLATQEAADWRFVRDGIRQSHVAWTFSGAFVGPRHQRDWDEDFVLGIFARDDPYGYYRDGDLYLLDHGGPGERLDRVKAVAADALRTLGATVAWEEL